MEITVNKEGNLSRKISYINGEFTPSTVVDWSAFEIIPTEGNVLTLTYRPLAVSSVVSGDTRFVRKNVANLCLLGHGVQPVQLCYNSGGSYSPLTNQMYIPGTGQYRTCCPVQFPIQIKSSSREGIDVFDQSGRHCFHVNGRQLTIAIKNIALKVESSHQTQREHIASLLS